MSEHETTLDHEGGLYLSICDLEGVKWPPGPTQVRIDCAECEEEIDDPEDLKALYEILLERLARSLR